ncbi:MAG: hydrogenase maturation nickel metallochaperone HypA [Candidatus Competibacteraceae bacterium]|nr:hydrogenase maturation nickel metallochaperone HypA [Candidatus Competibacteraceae bacterium]
MHELSLCQNIIDQLTDLAKLHDAVAVARIEVRVGALSGVEAQLLRNAFTLIQAGTIAETAELITEETAPRVTCRTCGAESETLPNNLSCPVCGNLDTKLIDGYELILARVELVRNED